jgi:ankyrin repeat protein
MDMCRFSSFHDAEYRKLAAAIDRILADHKATPPLSIPSTLSKAERQAYVNSLRFDQIDARHASIKSTHSKTCKWLLKKSEYLDWLASELQDEHNGFLWIKGKAGSGKSTILKYILSHVKKTMPGIAIISFFFNARGHDMEKSTIGMYRSLLVQLFECVPELQSVLDVLPRPPLSATGEFEGQWQLETLMGLFRDAVSCLGGKGLICFVDALDECHEDDVRRMVACFESLGQETTESGARVRICFSSRHYPYITVDRCVELVLEGQEGHQQDLANYLQSELKIGKSQRCEKIKEELLRRTNGIFLWLVLVVQILQKEFDRGRVHALQNRLEEIPPGLDELFRDILTRDTRNADDLLLCLQWILFAKRPLKREELYFAILAGTEPEHLEPWDAAEVTPSVMDRFILDCSKGLTALIRTKNQTVQFIHESVRDYLLKGNGLAHIRQDLAANFSGSSHEVLKLCCHNYLDMEIPEVMHLDATIKASLETHEQQPGNGGDDVEEVASRHDEDKTPAIVAGNLEIKELRERLCLRYPFLEYAVNNVFYHAEAALAKGIAQAAFINQFNLASWTSRNNVLEKYKIRRYSPSVTLLYIFAEKNLPALIRHELGRVPHMDIRGERHICPLRAAIAHKNEAAIRAFLMPADRVVDAGPSTLSTASPPEQDCDPVAVLLRGRAELMSSAKEWPLFLWAMFHGEAHLMNTLMATGKVELPYQGKIRAEGYIMSCTVVNLPQEYTDARLMPLRISLQQAYPIRSPLLPNQARMISLHELLLWAHKHGFKLLFRHLMWHYVADNMGGSELSRSMIPTNVRPLLTDCDLASLICQHAGPQLSLNAGLCGRLLLYGFQFQIPDLVKQIYQHNPTSLYHVHESEISSFLDQYVAPRDLDVLQLVVAGGNDNSTFRDGILLSLIRTTLHTRGTVGTICRLLLDNGLDLDSAAVGGVPLLSWASKVSQYNLVPLLLERCSVDVNATDSKGQTALSLATISGSPTTMQMLLDAGADANCQDTAGGAPLSYAASIDDEGKVRLLLKVKDIRVNIQDKSGDTPLLIAVSRENDPIVKLLLEHQDVDVNVKDKYGDTPLLRAMARSDESVVSLLLEHHCVDINLPDEGSCTPLLRAAKLGHDFVVKRLLVHRAVDVNARDARGGSPLWWAVSKGREAIVGLLLEHPNIDLDAGMKEAYDSPAETSPLEIARRGDHSRVVTMLEEKMRQKLVRK